MRSDVIRENLRAMLPVRGVTGDPYLADAAKAVGAFLTDRREACHLYGVVHL